jgi:hypothetical protein
MIRLWDIGYKNSCNFRRAIEREPSRHAAVHLEAALHSAWLKHGDTNFLFFLSRSTFD